MLGLGLDPDFATNGYIYVYWSPVHETNPTQNILSRYKMTGDHVDVASELRLLSINTQVGCLENEILCKICRPSMWPDPEHIWRPFKLLFKNEGSLTLQDVNTLTIFRETLFAAFFLGCSPFKRQLR